MKLCPGDEEVIAAAKGVFVSIFCSCGCTVAGACEHLLGVFISLHSRKRHEYLGPLTHSITAG